ncbi:MAG: hypothetical protein GX287_01210 [Fusobacteria bacterium]|nr:hypothetical protein [Fusobacteriota bacterium]
MNKEFVNIIKKVSILIIVVFIIGIMSMDNAMYIGFSLGGLGIILQSIMMYYDMDKMLTFKISSKKYVFLSYLKRYTISIIVLLILINYSERHFAFGILGLFSIKLVLLIKILKEHIKKFFKKFLEKNI